MKIFTIPGIAIGAGSIILILIGISLSSSSSAKSSSIITSGNNDNNSSYSNINNNTADRMSAISFLKLDSNPVDIAINTNANTVYITKFTSDYVSVIDSSAAKSNSQPSIKNITVQKGLWGIGVNPVTNKVYVASPASNSVFVIDGHTEMLIGQIRDVGNSPYQVAVNPKTNKVYVSTWNYPNGGYSVIDGNTDSVISKVKSLNGSSYGIAINQNTNKIYINNFSTRRDIPHTISIIDGYTDKVIQTLPMAAGRIDGSTIAGSLRVAPVAVDMHDNTAYATYKKGYYLGGNVSDFVEPLYLIRNNEKNNNNNSSVIKGEKTIVATTISSSATITETDVKNMSIESIAVDPQINLVYAYGISYKVPYAIATPSSSLVIVNGTTNQVIKTLDMGKDIGDVWAIAINPNNGVIYLATSTAPKDSLTIINRTALLQDMTVSKSLLEEIAMGEKEQQQQQQPPPTKEQLAECQERGIPVQSCNDTAILQKAPNTSAFAINNNKDKKQQNQVYSSMYLIGIGAAIAGIIAFITLRKTKK